MLELKFTSLSKDDVSDFIDMVNGYVLNYTNYSINSYVDSRQSFFFISGFSSSGEALGLIDAILVINVNNFPYTALLDFKYHEE